MPWQVTAADSYEGTYCAAVQGTKTPSELNLTIECYPGKMGFYSKITGARSVLFFIDEDLANVLNPAGDWIYIENDVTGGTHIFHWMFWMGDSVEDCARLDNVRFFSAD